MNKSKVFLGITALELIALLIFFTNGRNSVQAMNRSEIPAKRQIVKVLQLTDLSIWTEARYTRHPSQADMFTPFQDAPMAFDHFPAGSIIAPPVPHEDSTTVDPRD